MFCGSLCGFLGGHGHRLRRKVELVNRLFMPFCILSLLEGTDFVCCADFRLLWFVARASLDRCTMSRSRALSFSFFAATRYVSLYARLYMSVIFIAESRSSLGLVSLHLASLVDCVSWSRNWLIVRCEAGIERLSDHRVSRDAQSICIVNGIQIHFHKRSFE